MPSLSLSSTSTPLINRYRFITPKLHRLRPRTRGAKAIFVVVTVCLLFFFLVARRPSGQSGYSLFDEDPSRNPARPQKNPASSHHEQPFVTDSQRESKPSFHVLFPALQRSVSLCRMVMSAMILNYPPPTLIRYGQGWEAPSQCDATRDKITGIYDFLVNGQGVRDSDLVLVADGLDFFFQLPPELMIQRFQSIQTENNMKLRKKYGLMGGSQEKQLSDGISIGLNQRYTQKVLFGASKRCFPNMTDDAGCAAVPQSSLPPDVYGYKTDVHRDGHLNRPRWLNPSAAMGRAADLKVIYKRVLESMRNCNASRGDYLALTQIYGQQEYKRELEKRRASNGFKEWLYRQIGISDASNITGVTVQLQPGQRYEYGIGIDYTSQLFLNMFNSKHDVEWLQYNNITRTSSVQAEHGVPREKRLLLPSDIAHIPNPFTQSRSTGKDIADPPYNEIVDTLPNPQNRSWSNLPLLTNIHSAAVPVLVYVDGDLSHRDLWWPKMWYHPWARALLRRYRRTPSGPAAAQSAHHGGQEWWDMRGGRGGIWTDRGEWVDFPELCGGYERDIFNDGHGPWGKEIGDNSKPVYNQFGLLIKGKGDPEKLPES